MARARKTETKAQGEVVAEPEQIDTPDPMSVPDETDPTDNTDVEPVTLDEPSAPEPEQEPEPAAEPIPGVTPAAPRRSIFVPLVLGGTVAAGLGFGAATYVLPGLLQPSTTAVEVAALAEENAAQSGLIAGVSKDIERLKSDRSDAEGIASLADQLITMSEEIQEIRQALMKIEDRSVLDSATVAQMSERLAVIEKRPVASGEASASALEAFGREMADLRDEIDAQRGLTEATLVQIDEVASAATSEMKAIAAEANQLRADAKGTARQAAGDAALSRLRASLDSGVAIDTILADLAAAGQEVPEALLEQAQGVPSLASLRALFPAAARDALAVSLQETAGDGTWDKIGAFLRSQSGARSLGPRAGDDPDAVLSRAEAALKAGDLAGAVSETAGLPPQGQARMAEWVTLAQRRMAAVNAVEALTKAME